MDALADGWVERAELTDVTRLGWDDAGNSTMYSCAYLGQEYVFKQYSDEFREIADQNALGRLIAWRHRLHDESRRELDRYAAWPRRRIRHNGLLQGVLLPRAPAEFFRRMAPDGRWSPQVIASLIRRRTAESLIPGAPIANKTGALGNAIHVLLWFHRQGVLVNDVRELNILCTASGSAAYFVDCDVMFGPWGRVGPPAAPEYLQGLLPTGAAPSTSLELVKMAWVVVWVLLDDFALRHVPQEQLTKVVAAGEAELITRTAMGQPAGAQEWERLANRWVRWTGRVKFPLSGDDPQIIPNRRLKRTELMPEPPRRHSTGWVPDRYKRPSPAVRAATPHPLLVPDVVPTRPSRLPLILAAAGVLVMFGLAAATLLWGGIR